jgi:hypothetical protein
VNEEEKKKREFYNFVEEITSDLHDIAGTPLGMGWERVGENRGFSELARNVPELSQRVIALKILATLNKINHTLEKLTFMYTE